MQRHSWGNRRCVHRTSQMVWTDLVSIFSYAKAQGESGEKSWDWERTIEVSEFLETTLTSLRCGTLTVPMTV